MEENIEDSAEEGSISPNAVCRVCDLEGDVSLLIVCEGCNDCIHTHCTEPPLAEVPQGDFLCSMCQSEGSREKPGKAKDIHADTPVLGLLKTGQLVPQGYNAARIKKRAKTYAWTHKGVVKKAGNGFSDRVVPLPADRLELVREAHENCGHFGVKRTESLLVQNYTWPGLREDIQAYIGGCLPCKAANAKFQTDPQLHSIVVEPKSWTRVGMDFAGPFPVSEDQSRYVIVAID